uniref:Ribosomal protein/NADH dehydrogenase domain-containing protein n=1 Tax=Acrobeloides nanus TaxID=290746 RepID=A0A914DL87_9BILA
MCRMWEAIRAGVKWNLNTRLANATRAVDLKPVKSIKFSLDPFHHDNYGIRTVWFLIRRQKILSTNPDVNIESEIRYDREPPYFTTELNDGRQIVFKTSGMHPADIMMRFNRLCGNPEWGKYGKKPPEKAKEADLKAKGKDKKARK